MTDIARDGVSSLPPELWSRICACLDLCDVANFRLACRTFSYIGTRPVLRQVVVPVDPDSSDPFRAVANDPAKAKYIQSFQVVYTPKGHGHVLDTESPDRQAQEQGHADDERLGGDQDGIQNDLLICGLLSEVLPKLTALRSVIINCEDPRMGAKGDLFQTPVNHRQYAEPGRRALASLLEALQGCGTKLDTLKAGILEWRGSIGEMLPRTPLQPGLFSSLTNLDLHFCVCGKDMYPGLPGYPDSLEPSRLSQGGALPDFLGALPNLQALAISFCSLPSGSGSTYRVWLQDIVGTGHHWPRLATLSLSGMKLTRSLFMDLLARHKDTLRRLELYSVWLNRNWSEALDEIRAMLSLEDDTICSGFHLISADGGSVLLF
ncbi:hypothetical protein C8A01DRAFT_15473 [Parachaetomium inaequale]|uniref:F-box domain-containing protein n=1 Tax=Parachaetomium inaequale TaxID=2588326 RepID=A0AAN6SSR4_9PEZI|nr:hypothetical protein C8A01DRAFT_15473 [Parachaetomium inaequale]